MNSDFKKLFLKNLRQIEWFQDCIQFVGRQQTDQQLVVQKNCRPRFDCVAGIKLEQRLNTLFIRVDFV